MIPRLVLLLSVCFAIGGLGVWKVSLRQAPYAARESWKKYLSYIVIVGMVVALLIYQAHYYFFVALAIATGGGIEILRGVKGDNHRWPVFVLYLPIAALFLQFGRGEHTRDEVLLLYTPIVLYDGFSQLCGQLIKGPRLARKISPEKRISGVIGGIILTTMACAFAYPVAKLYFIPMICAFAVTGDLLASYLKRRWGIKDYGKLIPGHGGILDRFDSFMFTAAMATIINHTVNLYNNGR